MVHALKNVESGFTLWLLGELPPALVAFHGHVHPINPSWHLSGLGSGQPSSALVQKMVGEAAVIHFSGPTKPWLEIGSPQLRRLWTVHVNFSNEYIRSCSIVRWWTDRRWCNVRAELPHIFLVPMNYQHTGRKPHEHLILQLVVMRDEQREVDFCLQSLLYFSIWFWSTMLFYVFSHVYNKNQELKSCGAFLSTTIYFY